MRFLCTVFIFFLTSFATIYGQASKIVSTKFYSESLDRDIALKIYKPKDFSLTDQPYRLYIYLHGASVSVAWDYAAFMKPMLDELINNGEIEPIVVVCPVIRFEPVEGKFIGVDAHFYADSERNGKYESVITKDLLTWMENSYNISTRREQHAIGGFSMGAGASLISAVRYNDRFVCCVSNDGGNSPKAWLLDLPPLLDETPGPPYIFDPNNGWYSTIWFGLASAFSPNVTNPNMPEWLLDFPVDEQGNLIDSIITNQWMAKHDPLTLMKNPEIYKNDISIFIEATSGEREYNDFFHIELMEAGIPHIYIVTAGGHGLYEETTKQALLFIDAAMDSAIAKRIYNHDIQLCSSPHCITAINTFSNKNFIPQIKVKNVGNDIRTDFSISCKISHNGKEEYSDKFSVDSLKMNNSIDVCFKEWSPDKVSQNYNITFVSESPADENNKNDTLRTTLIISELVDDFESGFKKWITESNWGITNYTPHSGEFCMEDFPFFSYKNNTDTWAMFNCSFDFSQLEDAHLSCWTRHYFQSDEDVGFIEISIDSGKTWEQLGQPFKNRQTRWYQDFRSLTEYCGPGFENVWLRIRFISDAEKTSIGWFIDDIYIHPTATPVAQHENLKLQNCQLFDNYPNPFNAQTTIRFQLNRAAHTKLEIYNSLGQKVKTLFDENKPAGDYQIRWDGTDESGNPAASGLYMYKLDLDGFCQIKKMLILK